MKAMSICGNCASLCYLDTTVRVPGPVDNWFAKKGFLSTMSLFTNFNQQLKTGWIKAVPRKKQYQEDCDTTFEYADYYCYHINMEEPKNVEKVMKRYESFISFWKKVKTESDYYFVYTLNRIDINIKNKFKTLSNDTVSALNEIKKFIPIEKLILVGTPMINITEGFSSYVDIVPPFVNYLDIQDVKFCFMYKNHTDEMKSLKESFLNYAKRLKTSNVVIQQKFI